jgi:hypothetical protein
MAGREEQGIEEEDSREEVIHYDHMIAMIHEGLGPIKWDKRI